MSIDISVIIPTFNRAETLLRALQSVENQSFPPQEIIVVDDGSTDETGKMIAKDFPQIRYFFQENRGVSSARNLGIRKSRSECIAFLDSDDEWLPQKLQIQARAIEEIPDFKICHSDEIWIRNGVRVNQMKKHQKFGGHIFAKCLPLCVISPSAVFIHRSVFDDVGMFDENLPACEDYDLWLRVCPKYPVLFLEQKLIRKFGGHSDQLSRKFWGMDRFRITALEKIIRSGELSENDKNLATEMLIQKLQIYLIGAKKRGKIDEIKLYEKKLSEFILP